jgi:hypothetical protein
MQITPVNRRGLLGAYGVITLGAWMIASVVAAVAHSVQHTWMPAEYWLLPINLVSFYFLPLLAAGLLSLAAAVSGWSRSLTGAAVLVSAFTIARSLYWWSVARQIAGSPDSGRTTNLVSATPPIFWATSLLGVAAYVILIRIAVRTFACPALQERPNSQLQPTSGGDS